MSNIDNVIIQVRARLKELEIKLWEEPYYFDGLGSMESHIDDLARDFSENLHLSVSNCKMALNELQDGALRKLASRREYELTGIATFSVRRINNQEFTSAIVAVKCPIDALGDELHEVIAAKLLVSNANQIKCISAGKIVDPKKTLSSQGLQNNQQLMVIVSELANGNGSSKEAMHDRINKIKMDVEKIVDSKRQLFEMEDQDGNPVYVPPNENRALMMAMGYCEKARVAIKRQQYDEALILLLEADELFTTCNSRFLDCVDNYALVNLDIVWCYLCLKNVTQLPDAQRRLEICEKSFQRSYGKDLERLIALKGNASPERAIIMRLHLLQGVVYFHQNRRNEAYEKLDEAADELLQLKVDDNDLAALVEMGYEQVEARRGLRVSGGNMDDAIGYIHECREKLLEARKRSTKERKIHKKLLVENPDKDWVNPRSVCTLMEMGFSSRLVVEALKRTNNDLQASLYLLEHSADELAKDLPPEQNADADILEQLLQLGFDGDLARVALVTTQNNLEKSLDFLVKVFGNEEELRKTMDHLNVTAAQMLKQLDKPSTSTGGNALLDKIMKKAEVELESLQAFDRFNADLVESDEDYLDLPLLQEEQILAEYKRMLEE